MAETELQKPMLYLPAAIAAATALRGELPEGRDFFFCLTSFLLAVTVDNRNVDEKMVENWEKFAAIIRRLAESGHAMSFAKDKIPLT